MYIFAYKPMVFERLQVAEFIIVFSSDVTLLDSPLSCKT